MKNSLKLICESFYLDGIIVYNANDQNLSFVETVSVIKEDLKNSVVQLFNTFIEFDRFSSGDIKGCIEFRNSTVCFYIPEEQKENFFLFFSKRKEININALIWEIKSLL